MTSVAIHQPNFCPWLGYFAKILRCDLFILLDDVEFSKNGWTNRVRIKTPQGAQWLTVPVLASGRSYQLITETQINNTVRWAPKLVKTLEANYAKASYFRAYAADIADILLQNPKNLSELNINLIQHLIRTLDLQTRMVRSSELPGKGQATDLLVSLVKAVDGDTYLSGDGAEYQEDGKFERADILLQKSDFYHPQYTQLRGDFEPGLSILDPLFNLGADGVRQLLLDELASKQSTHVFPLEEVSV